MHAPFFETQCIIVIKAILQSAGSDRQTVYWGSKIITMQCVWIKTSISWAVGLKLA